MRETDKSIEAQLASLAPKAPSEKLKGRIAQRLSNESDREASPKRRSRVVAFAVLAAAASLAVVLKFSVTPEVAENTRGVEVAQNTKLEAEYLAPQLREVEFVANGFEAVDRVREVLAAEESPVFLLENGQPAQSVYVRYLDTVLMENVDTRTSVMIASPREEYRVVPVVTY